MGLRRKTRLRSKKGLERRTPFRRSGGPSRGGRINPRNEERRDAEWKRAYGSEERVRWVQGLPCLACGSRPSENAHTETGGMGRKADAETIVPLCPDCHRQLHEEGADTWQERTGLDLKADARRIEEAWQRRQS